MADLITTARARLSPELADTTNPTDTQISAMIAAASAGIRAALNRPYSFDAQATYTRKFDGRDTYSIMTGLINPVVDSSTVVAIIDGEGTTTTYNSASDPTSANTFRVNVDTGELQFVPEDTSAPGIFEYGFQNVSVTITSGFATSIPEEIQELCATIVGRIWTERNTDETMESESMGRYSYRRSATIVKDLLQGPMFEAVSRFKELI